MQLTSHREGRGRYLESQPRTTTAYQRRSNKLVQII